MAAANQMAFQNCLTIEMGGCWLGCVTQLDTRRPPEANISRCGCAARQVNGEAVGETKTPASEIRPIEMRKMHQYTNSKSNISSAECGWCPVGSRSVSSRHRPAEWLGRGPMAPA